MRRTRLVPALILAALLLATSGVAPAAADRWCAQSPVLGIVDAGRQANAARQAGATWDRALFLWQQIQPNAATDWQLDAYLDQARLRPTLAGGISTVGIVQGTPGWAAVDWHDGAAA